MRVKEKRINLDEYPIYANTFDKFVDIAESFFEWFLTLFVIVISLPVLSVFAGFEMFVDLIIEFFDKRM